MSELTDSFKEVDLAVYEYASAGLNAFQVCFWGNSCYRGPRDASGKIIKNQVQLLHAIFDGTWPDVRPEAGAQANGGSRENTWHIRLG